MMDRIVEDMDNIAIKEPQTQIMMDPPRDEIGVLHWWNVELEIRNMIEEQSGW
jgi:hypothetical protein